MRTFRLLVAATCVLFAGPALAQNQAGDLDVQSPNLTIHVSAHALALAIGPGFTIMTAADAPDGDAARRGEWEDTQPQDE